MAEIVPHRLQPAAIWLARHGQLPARLTRTWFVERNHEDGAGTRTRPNRVVTSLITDPHLTLLPHSPGAEYGFSVCLGLIPAPDHADWPTATPRGRADSVVENATKALERGAHDRAAAGN